MIDPTVQAWLEDALTLVDAVAGTVHRRTDGALLLVAAVNIPAAVQALVRIIPKGKGMAGLAWQRGEPVRTCNLRDDPSTDIRPGARAVAAKAAIALPVLGDDGALRAVTGFAFDAELSLTGVTLARLEDLAASTPR